MTVVYSAIYGGIEAPKVQPDLGCPLVMFTDDRDLEAPGWEVRHEPLPNVDGPMMRSRYWKYHSGEVGDPVTIWLDGSMTVRRDGLVGVMRERLVGLEALFVRHPWRDCIYEEAVAADAAPKYHSQPMFAQVEHYRRAGHPEHWGLAALGMQVRRSTEAVRAYDDAMWAACQRWSYHDQLAAPFVLARGRLRYGWISDHWEHWWTIGAH